jgi:hypothetical protein
MDRNALSRMGWDQLLQLRRQAEEAEQPMLAPFEHRAYAREDVAENPWMAPAYLAMVPGYQVLKMLRGGARTPASWDQVRQGYTGVLEGLQQAVRR